jgi:hypothetical protein
MPIAPQFQQFVDDELSRSAELLDRIALGTLEQLRQPREGMLSPPERQHYFELIELLRNRHNLLREGFTNTLNQLVRADVEDQHHSRASADPLGDLGGMLTLMDESQVEADIEISRAAQLIDATAEWELRELQSFTSTLNGQLHVTAESNPFRPVFYARALWHGACAVTSAPVQRSIFLRLAAGVASGLLKKAWAAASSRIEAMGFTPSMYRTVVLSPSASMARPPAAQHPPPIDLPTLPQGPATLGRAREQLSSKSAQGQQQRPPSPTDLPPLPRVGFSPGPGFEQALERLEALLRQLPAAAASAPSAQHSDLAAPRLRDHLKALTAATQDAVDHQIIELMARFFDVVLSDTKVHTACRPLLAKLQSSVLQVALHDPTMMQDHQHAAWLFIDQLNQSFTLYSDASDPRLVALAAFGEALVQDTAASRMQDVWLYRRALTKLEAHLQAQREAAIAAAQSHVDELLLVEKRDQLQRQISQRLVDQMVPLRVSPGIRRFITGDWARVLAHAMIRHGEQSETTVSYMKTVDDLLWSLNPPDHPQSRQRLLTLLPTLLQRLHAGMALIDLAPAEQQHVLDELMAVHTEALRPGQKAGGGGLVGLAPTAASTAAATPEQILQMLRDEPDPGLQAGPSFADSLIELSSMDTVPADLIDTHPASEDSDFDSMVDAMRPGSRHRLFLRGRWTRAELLWRSPRGAYFLFAGEYPGRTHSITQAALERLSGEKLLLPLEERPLSQRALQTLINELS